MRAKAQPRPCGALRHIAATSAELPGGPPLDDQPGTFIESALDRSAPGKFEKIRLDRREIPDDDGHRLEPSTSVRFCGLARNAVDLRGQSHLVHGSSIEAARGPDMMQTLQRT